MELKFGQFYRTKYGRLLEFVYYSENKINADKWYIFRNISNGTANELSELEVKNLIRDEASDFLYGE